LGLAGVGAGLGAPASRPASNRNGTIFMRRLGHGGRGWEVARWAGFGMGCPVAAVQLFAGNRSYGSRGSPERLRVGRETAKWPSGKIRPHSGVGMFYTM
jgi:hypothetical protein